MNDRRFVVREAIAADAGTLARLQHALWPDDDAATEPSTRADDAAAAPAEQTTWLALDADDRAIGFAEASLRRDYVNGTESSPVGFLEGWYVQPAWRGRGVGRALIAAVEAWTRARGCTELASDALLDHIDAHAAHRACGFAETERVVYFRKPLAD